MLASFPLAGLAAILLTTGSVSSMRHHRKRAMTPVGPVVWINPNPTSSVGQCYPLVFQFTTSVEPQYLQVLTWVGSEQVRTKFVSFPSSSSKWVDSTTRMTFTIPKFPYASGTLVDFLIRGTDGAYSTLEGSGFTVQQSDISDCLNSDSTGLSSFGTMTGQGQFTTYKSSAAPATVATTQAAATTAVGTTTSPSSNPATTTANGDVLSSSSHPTTDGIAGTTPSPSPEPATNSLGVIASLSPSLPSSSIPSASPSGSAGSIAPGSNSSNIVTSSTTPTEEKKTSVASAVGGGVAGGVFGIALLLGVAFFFWRRNLKRISALGRRLGSEEKLPDSAVPALAPEPWTYSVPSLSVPAVSTPSAIPMLQLDNGVRVERDGGFQNDDFDGFEDDDDVEVLPPVYSDATSRSRSSPAASSYENYSTTHSPSNPSIPIIKPVEVSPSA